MSDYECYGKKVFEDLVGKTVVSITVSDNKTVIDFGVNDGSKYTMYHKRDCCEDVYVESVDGDLLDLIGTPILQAEVVDSNTTPDGFKHEYGEPGSQTWTFYKLATIEGSVTIRWFGSSNGYYSEAVTFERVAT